MSYGNHTDEKIKEVVKACEMWGKTSIVALAGVPGTGKSYIGSIAAQEYAKEPTRVRELQFHQSFSYEEFVEGLRLGEGGAVVERPGMFLEWNQQAWDDPNNQYVLFIEEFTRGNVSAILGEILTAIEYRDRPFTLLYSRAPLKVAPNLVILCTYNPTDRSALDLDQALIRRMRIISFPPDAQQLAEMLAEKLPPKVITALQKVFETCRETYSETYETQMPFGHGIFAGVKQESPDLHVLWHDTIRHLLYRPMLEPHPFSDTIRNAYPWRDKSFALP